MEFIPTKIVDRPMRVQEIGGERIWEAQTNDPFCNVWYEVTDGECDPKRWCRIDGEMIPEKDAKML